METSQTQKDAPRAEDKTTATEWVVIAALILVVIIGGVTLLGERISGVKEPAETRTVE